MMWMIIATLTFSVLFPLYILWWMMNGRTVNRSQLLLKSAATVLVIYTLYVFNYWGAISYYLRYIWLLLLIPVLAIAWDRTSHQPWRSRLDVRQWGAIIGSSLLILFFGNILMNAWAANTLPEESDPVVLTWPFMDGTYLVGQGGSTQAMNAHNAVHDRPELRGQLYALDILQLGRWGNRASGIYPSDLQAYTIFGTPVHAPCSGTVSQMENNLPDLEPPDRDADNLPGNYLLIECDNGVFVLLAHLREGSVRVESDQAVTEGEHLAEVGNSGNTSEPHLHIHAQTEPDEEGLLHADPIPMRFHGVGFPVRNDRIRVSVER